MARDRQNESAAVFRRALHDESAPRPFHPLTPTVAPRPKQAELTVGLAEDRLRSLLLFAKHKYYWSPARVFRALWNVLTNVPKQMEIFRLMRLPIYADFVRADPRFCFRFLIRDYLARGFSTRQRADCFLHHYRRLYTSTSPNFLDRALNQSIVVLQARGNAVHIEVSLGFSRPFEKEGELSLELHVDGMVVFVLSFTIIPGWVVQSDAKDVLLISRLQGTNGYYTQIRAATRALCDVGPAALLLAALNGFANAFGIDRMVAVSAFRQSSFSEELSVQYKSAYDDFFSEIGVKPSTSGFFLSSIPLEDRPMTFIKRGHKIRTREKRQFKLRVADEVCQILQRSGVKVVGRSAESSSATPADIAATSPVKIEKVHPVDLTVA